ncbi:MAG: helix-turn-helix domain-containing protein [Dissulfurispiraceae bacterium]
MSPEELEKGLLIEAIERAGNNQTLTAKVLTVSDDSLKYYVEKFGFAWLIRTADSAKQGIDE